MKLSAEKVLPWLLRVALAALPFSLGFSIGYAIDDWDTPVRSAATVLLWFGWAATAVASCIALPAALIAVRAGSAAAFTVALYAAVGGRPLGIATAFIAAALAARPEIAEWFVNGPAYANEKRYPLKPPGALLLGPLWLAGAVIVAGPVAGVLLVAGGAYVVGGAVLVAGLALAVLSARSLFTLTRRWLVFVPAGVVVHDPLALVDPVLLERKVVETMRAADADTDSLDLTQNALGLAVEIVLTEKVPMILNLGRRKAESGSSARLIVTPSRPGRVLSDAATRRIPVG